MALCKVDAVLDLELRLLGRLRKVRQADVSRHRGSELELIPLR